MVEVSTQQQEVKITRSFEGMEAYDTDKRLRIVYKEETTIDGQVIKSENKEYIRNYDFWKASELGQAIIGLIESDLQQEDPAAPRTIPEA